ncbi:hypothetical protein BVRB_9g215170 [Beta vulgaris subsp. vulgaris]|nr:hypothetical protein BVRB_9g215170 [Beta vulgaris subsp. vulgaris]
MSADKSLLFLSKKSKILQLLRCLFVSVFLFILHAVHSVSSKVVKNGDHGYDHDEQLVNSSGTTMTDRGSDTAIARAIYQLLTLVNSISTSSRKYEVVRSLVEKLIDENLKEGSEALRQVNCVVLSEAFGKTISQLEADLLDQESNLGQSGFGVRGVVRAAKGWYRVREGGNEPAAMEKIAAELLWLAHKLEESGGGEVAVGKWASAKNLGWLAVAAEPRVQASLVKLTAFLIKQAKDISKEQQTEGGISERLKQTNMKMLTTWLPLLCRASNGTDAPTLSTIERSELERALEKMIDMIEEKENQEKVLSLWLHHFAHCSSSDWPNLYGSYIRWCNVSRKLLLKAG